MKKALEPDATANKRPSVEVIGIGGGGTQMGGMPGYGTARSAGATTSSGAIAPATPAPSGPAGEKLRCEQLSTKRQPGFSRHPRPGMATVAVGK